uniref:UDENN domain-containing protein n=1 Tax=Oryza nivara TaxID=4536 RepID=A0A0E0GGQ8_ORYNI
MELSGETASPAPEPEPPGQPEVSPRGAGMFEDAVEGSSTATESPVAVARPDGEATTESSSPSASRTLAGDEPAAAGAGEVEAYGGDESPSVSEPREESGSVDTGSAASPSVLRSEQRARGAEEQENSMAAQSGEGSPAREETKSRISSAPSSPVLSGTSTSSSSPLSQIKHQARHVRTGSFQRFRQQMQRAWKWGPIGSGGGGERSPREQLLRTTVNFEAMAHQKRQWYQIQSKSRDNKQYKEPTTLFEHFFVVGLHSYANVGVIEDAFAKKKAWESNVEHSEIVDLRKIQYHGPIPTMEPQILFKYPPVKKAEIREIDLPSFCFPEGVKARLIERTPSMSDLNEVVFGQVSDNAPLYGVCLHVQEIVQRAPGILGMVSPLNPTSYKPSRFLVSAPRCYCLLTKVPFFELHYEMLNSIIAQERLDRITQFASEIALAEPIPRSMKEQSQVNGEDFESANELSYNDWTEYAVPVNSISGLISSSGLPSEGEIPSYLFRSWEPNSPESMSASETSDSSYIRELEKEGRHSFQQYEDCISENLGSCCDSFGRTSYTYENGHTSPDLLSTHSPISRRIVRAQSMESLHSSVKGVGSDEEEELNMKQEIVVDDEKVMGWAKVHNNEPLQIVCGYHALALPPRGGELVFHPLEHLQPVKYSRPGLSLLGLGDTISDNGLTSVEKTEVNARLAAAEEAIALSIWTTATICRALSLESVLELFAAALLEKQIVVICSNLGVLSAIVLSVMPMIRPFQWQSLLLPVLPRKLVDFLDAPVPFIAGVQHKPPDIKMKASSIVRINVDKDQVKACSLPQLPRFKELVSDLSPIHARLSCENALAKRHPIYKCNEVQVVIFFIKFGIGINPVWCLFPWIFPFADLDHAEAAWQFLNVMRSYLESLCSDLRSHTITNVQSNNDRVSLLLKDSFIDSFPSKDRPFVKLFVETQMFSVLSDSRLSTFENELT